MEQVPLCTMRSLGRIIAGNWCSGVDFANRGLNHAIPLPSARLVWAFGPLSQRSGRGFVATGFTSPAPAVDRDAIFQADEGSTMGESLRSSLRKKKVAIWVGYNGTGFKGLQLMRGSEAVNTIECELQRAIFEAGGILESNYGNLEKINWTRSSRTDKGVHSLSTVISMKMELPPSAWVRDPNGLVLADGINVHLPPSIQIFGIVPVSKGCVVVVVDGSRNLIFTRVHLNKAFRSFNARRFCCSRTYQYLLPASMLGLSEISSPELVTSILEEFRSILNMFQGRFAFHNYTIRRFYRADFRAKSSPRSSRNWRTKNAPESVELVKSESLPSGAKPIVEGSFPSEASPFANERCPVEDAPVGDEIIVSEIMGEVVEHGQEEMQAVTETKLQKKDPDRIMAYWLDAPDLSDKVSASHFRRILECCCGGLENFNGVHFVRVSITGESFMVHQIRKIVATAVAVLKEILPRDIIPISLCRHSRIALPLVPPDGLVLAKNSFFPYRQLQTPAVEREFRDSDIGLSRLEGLPKLQISPEMSERADLFWRDVLLPDIAPQLDGSLPLWSTWQEKLLLGSISEDEVETVRARYTKWREEGVLKMGETKSSTANNGGAPADPSEVERAR